MSHVKNRPEQAEASVVGSVTFARRSDAHSRLASGAIVARSGSKPRGASLPTSPSFSLFRYRRPFLLLEILICFTIALLCIIPFLKEATTRYLSERKELEGLELSRLADWTFSEIIEQYAQGAISWDSLPQGAGHTLAIPLPAAQITGTDGSLRSVAREAICRAPGKPKEGVDGLSYRLLYVEVRFPPSSERYRYALTVQKAA